MDTRHKYCVSWITYVNNVHRSAELTGAHEKTKNLDVTERQRHLRNESKLIDMVMRIE